MPPQASVHPVETISPPYVWWRRRESNPGPRYLSTCINSNTAAAARSVSGHARRHADQFNRLPFEINGRIFIVVLIESWSESRSVAALGRKPFHQARAAGLHKPGER